MAFAADIDGVRELTAAGAVLRENFWGGRSHGLQWISFGPGPKEFADPSETYRGLRPLTCHSTRRIIVVRRNFLGAGRRRRNPGNPAQFKTPDDDFHTIRQAQNVIVSFGADQYRADKTEIWPVTIVLALFGQFGRCRGGQSWCWLIGSMPKRPRPM